MNHSPIINTCSKHYRLQQVTKGYTMKASAMVTEFVMQQLRAQGVPVVKAVETEDDYALFERFEAIGTDANVVINRQPMNVCVAEDYAFVFYTQYVLDEHGNEIVGDLHSEVDLVAMQVYAL